MINFAQLLKFNKCRASVKKKNGLDNINGEDKLFNRKTKKLHFTRFFNVKFKKHLRVNKKF